MKKTLLIVVIVMCSFCGYSGEDSKPHPITSLEHLIGKWESVEKVYDLEGKLVKTINALVECQYVLDSTHISLIGYNNDFKVNDETSIWYLSYMFRDEKFYTRGLMPSIGRMDELSGKLENQMLIVTTDTLQGRKGPFQFSFEINMQEKDLVKVKAIWSDFNKKVIVRDEIWKRMLNN